VLGKSYSESMNTMTIPKKEYQTLVQRQKRFEEELKVMRSLLEQEINEERIKPSALKRWERISKDMDQSKGYFFSSSKEALAWLKNL
jgi:Iap family predicted aminopeptidase